MRKNAWMARYRLANLEQSRAASKAWHDANREYRKAYNAAYAIRKRDEIRLQRAEYRRANKDALREINAKWRANNRERNLEAKAADYAANRDRRKALAKAWREANPAKCSAYRWARRIKQKKYAVGDTAQIWRWEQSWRSLESVACHWCEKTQSGRKCHVDHVVPLSLGGAHAVDNMVIACAACNQRKRSMPLDRWLKKIGRAA